MKKYSIQIIITCISCLFFGIAKGQVPAFPGAEGGGMYTTGGRGGMVYYVNTLDDNDSGNATTREGSLRWCLSRSGKRTILFKVSGTIFLRKNISISNGDVTIAGQSAPGDGICIANYPVYVSASNVIIKYMRFRMGDNLIISGGDDALGGRFFTNVIVDHCSMSWSTDECSSFYNCNNFTMQWCIISESLRLSTHDKGPHGYGGIWGGTNTTFHHNLLAHHDSRTPRFGPGQNIPPHIETIDHRNNVIYNYGNCYGAEAMNINLVNNYYKPGAVSLTGAGRGRIISIDKDKNVGSIRYDKWGQFYIDGNVVDDGKNEANCLKATNDNWTYGVYNQFHSSYGTVSSEDKVAMRMAEPFDIKAMDAGKLVKSSVTTHTAPNAYNKVLLYAGASFHRDSYDQRIINETQTGTTTFKGLSKYNGWGTGHPDDPSIDWRSKNYPKKGILDSHRDIKPADADDNWSPWPLLQQGEVPADSDRDGIPDGWLETNYPNKTATDINEEGYTYLEVYLNGLVKDITTKQNEDAISGIHYENTDIVSKQMTGYYDATKGTCILKSSHVLSLVSIYSISGQLLVSRKCNDRSECIDINTDSNILIVSAITNQGDVVTTKIVRML